MKKYLIPVILVMLAAGASAMDLKESVDVGIKKNPAVISAQKKYAAASARFNQAVSAFFPTVNLNGEYDKAHASPQTVQIAIGGGAAQNVAIGTDSTATVTGYKAELQQPVFVAALFPGYGIAKKGADAANEEFQLAIVNTRFNVTQTYFGVLKSIKMEKLMSDAYDRAVSHRKQVQSKLNAGTVTKADLLRSKVREANASVSLTQSKYDIDLSKNSFNNALGNDQAQPVNLKDEGFSGKVDNLPDYDTLLSTAYANRPDWKMYLLSAGISKDQLQLSQSEYLPQVMLTANTGSQLTKYPEYNSNVNSWKVAGTGTWKLFDSLGRENRVREAADNLAAQEANVEQFRNNISLEVRDAYLTLKSALDTIVSTKQAVESAEESYKVTDSRYNAGMGTNVEVLDAQVDLTQAWTAHLDALFNVEVAKARINKAVGKVIL